MRINPFTTALATAALALGAAMPAQAATQDLGDLTDASNYFGHAFSGPSGDFTDYYTFTLSKVQNIASLYTFTTEIANVFTLGINSVTLSGGGLGNPLFGDTFSKGFSFEQLAPGAYTLTLQGNVSGVLGGSYAGVIAGSVPEPETYAMMLIGLGGVAWATRRRKPR